MMEKSDPDRQIYVTNPGDEKSHMRQFSRSDRGR